MRDITMMAAMPAIMPASIYRPSSKLIIPVNAELKLNVRYKDNIIDIVDACMYEPIDIGIDRTYGDSLLKGFNDYVITSFEKRTGKNIKLDMHKELP